MPPAHRDGGKTVAIVGAGLTGLLAAQGLLKVRCSWPNFVLNDVLETYLADSEWLPGRGFRKRDQHGCETA